MCSSTLSQVKKDLTWVKSVINRHVAMLMLFSPENILWDFLSPFYKNLCTYFDNETEIVIFSREAQAVTV